MTTIKKIIVFGAILSFGVFVGFLTLKPQIAQAQNYPTICNQNATQKCVGNSIFWYDSCGKQQSWVKDCFNGCQNGQCINSQPEQIVPPLTIYTKHRTKNCYNDNLYWYDSNGIINDLYKTCSDNNECTKDSCLGNQCVNEGDCKNQVAPFIGTIDISVLCGVKNSSINLLKNITVTADQIINCLMIVKNISTIPINDITVRADIPTEIINTSGVKIDGLAFNGNITSGINIGNFSPNLSKAITFEGKTQSLITQVSAKQITGITSSGNLSATDSSTINFQPIVADNITAPVEPSPFVKFLKRWYIWILTAIVMIFLFFVIFRRISSNV